MIGPGPRPAHAEAPGWRLLLDPPADGVWNMAVDEALLASAQTAAIPTLRLYGWRGAWLSLGHAQTLSPERASRCRHAGVGIVRRVTGGAAVVHGADLTYAVAAPRCALPDGLEDSYALVSRALVRALAALGISARASAAGPRLGREDRGFDCFERPARDEICVLGRKLVGSAQRRTRNGILQHGSLRLRDDLPHVVQAAGCSAAAASSLYALGLRVGDDEVRAALVQGFSQELGVAFTSQPLRAEEHDLAVELARARRAKPWARPASSAGLLSRLPLASR